MACKAASTLMENQIKINKNRLQAIYGRSGAVGRGLSHGSACFLFGLPSVCLRLAFVYSVFILCSSCVTPLSSVGVGLGMVALAPTPWRKPPALATLVPQIFLYQRESAFVSVPVHCPELLLIQSVGGQQIRIKNPSLIETGSIPIGRSWAISGRRDEYIRPISLAGRRSHSFRGVVPSPARCSN